MLTKRGRAGPIPMLSSLPPLFRILPAATVLLLAGGCVSRPAPPPYRRVDPTSPAYQSSVARETAAEQAKGRSAAEAAAVATRRVNRQTIAAEKQRRLHDVAPLTAALDALQRPRGCWAYTVTTTTVRSGQTSTLVERFNPFEPEERLWTLLSIDGREPTETGQADYRRMKLKQWKREQERARQRQGKRSPAELSRQSALYAEFETEQPDPAGPITYRFERARVSVALLGDIPPSRETYVIDSATGAVRRHTRTQLEPAAVLGGSIKITTDHRVTDYALIDPTLPPFPMKISAHFRYRAFGKDSGGVHVERTYADYRKVKCYDDRFEVQLGELTPVEFLPP